MIDHTSTLADFDRLAAVAGYDLDDPDLRRRLDELSVRTATALGQPVSMVSLVLDTAHLVAGSTPLPGWGADVEGVPVEWSFCANAVVTSAPYVVADAARDPLQHDNPLVTLDGVACYAGVPLVTPEGHTVGAHCVFGAVPHEFTTAEIDHLRTAAAEAVAVLEEHRLPA
ncbi:GAF domain-containing protein [Kineococcus sp. SYSU DK005]|uniref:GAF domain-containing protein n=1 Tax=Kineococcus sp. SYSU DK005 TaxID=3383126 RepID=UPI003D7E2485